MDKKKQLEKVFSKKLSDFILDSNKKTVNDAEKSIKEYADFLASILYEFINEYFNDKEKDK